MIENEKSKKKKHKRITKKKNNLSSYECKIYFYKFLLLFISISILLGLINIIYFVYIKDSTKKEINYFNKRSIIDEHNKEKDPFQKIIPEYKVGNEKLVNEFEFKISVGDLRRIEIIQNYDENRLFEGKEFKRKTIRKNIYDIFIISESNPEKDFIYFYNKIYTAAIFIVGECFSSINKECYPKILVDLSGTKPQNLTYLEEKNDLKDIPIPICLFNITNNNIITSMKCPESFSEKKKLLILDLSYFRLAGLKSRNKKELNATITKEIKGENLIIRKTNRGICDGYSSFSSFCTKDVNITTNKEGRILHYEEKTDMIIETDERNSYKEIKKTHLKDISSEISLFDPQKYNITLNKLLAKLNRYLKYDEKFSNEDFQELLLINKEGEKKMQKLLNRRSQRKLYEEDLKGILKYPLLEIFSSFGNKIELNLMNNIGIEKEFLEANTELKIDNITRELTSSKVSSLRIYEIINSFITLSKAGNNLAFKLLKNINVLLDNITNYINDEITSLHSHIKYKDIFNIFNISLSSETINIIPFIIIQESSNLKTNLEQLLNSIEKDQIKKDLKLLNININNYTNLSHQLINELLENLSELVKSLNSSITRLTKISIYYLNNTSNSYISIIETVEKILMNYYKDEFNLINTKVEQTCKVFEDAITNSLKKQNTFVISLYGKLINGNYSIENANEEKINEIINNLNYIIYYMNELIFKIKTKLKKEMDIKDNGYLISEYDITDNKERSIDLITNAKEIIKKLDNDVNIDNTFDEIMNNFRNNFTNILKFMDEEKNVKFPLNERVLNEEYFSENILNKMERDINQSGMDIINSIKKENEDYLKEKDKIMGEFIKNEQDYLNNLIFEIESLFTEKKFGEIEELFEIAFNSCLTKTKNELINNKNEVINYINNMVKYFQNDKEILEELKHYKIEKIILKTNNSYVSVSEYELSKSIIDSIINKNRTDLYSSNYETFIKSFEKTKEFINNGINQYLFDEYKSIMFKLKEVLQKFKNNKLTTQYPDTSEFFFIDKHIQTIYTLYNKLNNKILDNNFINNFKNTFDDYKKEVNDILINLDSFINQNHNAIKSKNLTRNIIYDICIEYKRTIFYNYENEVLLKDYNPDIFCLKVKDIQLVSHSIYNDNNYSNFKKTFNDFYSTINDKINKYTSKITTLKDALSKAEKNVIKKKNYFILFESNSKYYKYIVV